MDKNRSTDNVVGDGWRVAVGGGARGLSASIAADTAKTFLLCGTDYVHLLVRRFLLLFTCYQLSVVVEPSARLGREPPELGGMWDSLSPNHAAWRPETGRRIHRCADCLTKGPTLPLCTLSAVSDPSSSCLPYLILARFSITGSSDHLSFSTAELPVAQGHQGSLHVRDCP